MLKGFLRQLYPPVCVLCGTVGSDNRDLCVACPADCGECQQELSLEAEHFDSSSGPIENAAGRVILMGDSGQICWQLPATLASVATVFYSNGEVGGDTLQLSYDGGALGPEMTVLNHEGWNGPYTTVSTLFASLEVGGELCLTGSGAGFIASVDRLVLE